MESRDQNKKISFLFLLAIANLLAAFGGGTIMSQARAAAEAHHAYAYNRDDALTAFMVGAAIGMILIGLMKLPQSRLAQRLRILGGYLSFGCAFTSLILAFIYYAHINRTHSAGCWDMKLFLALLGIRFSLWFIPRVLRSDAAAGYGQHIGWIEFFYSFGMVLGLITWTPRLTKWIGDMDSFVLILIFDAGFQILAGITDLYARRTPFYSQHFAPSENVRISPLPIDWGMYAKITLAIVALTIGTQIVAFEFRANLGVWLGPKIMASFYAGTAISALIYGRVETKLELPFLFSANRFGALIIDSGNKQRRFSFALISSLAVFPLVIAVVVNLYLIPVNCEPTPCSGNTGYKTGVAFIVLVAVAAFFFEWIALSLLNFIGVMAKEKQRKGLVAVTYSLMGMGGAIGVGLLSLPEDRTLAHFGLLFTLLICLFVTNAGMWLTARKPVLA